MARFPRLILPGYPYHVTQRGNRRLQTFFEEGDYELYRDLLAEAAQKAGSRAEDWRWSSARAHLAGEDDALVRVAPALDRYGDFASFLGAPADYADA